MLSKSELIKGFSKDYKKYYSTALFESEGFERKKCRECGMFFWTTDSDRELCGDSAHEPYSFIRENPSSVGYEEFWNRFSDFFKKNGHAVIGRYPVVSRWRPDLYFTIAGIQDFQRIENGKMSFEYPANPLLVPQMCMRFSDIANVGVTGRHLTSFMMANQTSFNYPKEGYWRDRTIKINYEYLTKVLGADKDAITYIEDVWAMGDFSEFGPSLEFYSKGLELGNNVFTEFEYDGVKTNELEGKVVDVGWGFERLIWYYTGEPTLYDAVFRNQLRYIYDNAHFSPDKGMYYRVAPALGGMDLTDSKVQKSESDIAKMAGIHKDDYTKIIKPMQAAYAIADHTRTLLFAISDGALPSNVGGGYNLRVILRRVFDFIDRYKIDIDVIKLMEMHADEVMNLYKGLRSNMDEINEIVSIERERYTNTKASARKIVSTIIEKKEELTAGRLRLLYESNGITPEFISAVALERGVRIDMPDEAYFDIINGDFAKKEKRRDPIVIDTKGLEKTEQLFYSFVSAVEAKVVRIEGNIVVLDRSPFYPEGGGQEADNGTVGGIRVADVASLDGVILHLLAEKPNFSEGEQVKCAVDIDRRIRLMAHHTATHLINASARSVLGEHAWQEGARKGPTKAHIDLSHYEKLSDEQTRRIEDIANGHILRGIKVKMQEMDRKAAESKYGFGIYQGHGVPASRLRIVTIHDLKGNLIDAQACGGLHIMDRETMIGLIKIVSSSRPHDGIVRLDFVAGPAALHYINSMEDTLNGIAKASGIDLDKLGKGIEQQVMELQRYRKEYRNMADELAGYIAEKMVKESRSDVIRAELGYDRLMLRSIATKIVESDEKLAVVLWNRTGEYVCIAGSRSGKSADEVLRAEASKARVTLVGGGSKRIAEGRVGG